MLKFEATSICRNYILQRIFSLKYQPTLALGLMPSGILQGIKNSIGNPRLSSHHGSHKSASFHRKRRRRRVERRRRRDSAR